MARPSGGGDGRRPRYRPSNGTAAGATRRRGVRELCRAWRCGPGAGRRDRERGPTRHRGGGGRRRPGRGRGNGRTHRSRAGTGDDFGEQRRRVLAGHAGHVRPGAGRAHAPGKRGGRDPCHARRHGEHAGAALWADRQYGLGRSDRDCVVRQCILRGNEGGGGDSHASLCIGAGPARHHRERRGAGLRPHRSDTARPRRSGLARHGATLRGTRDDGLHR